MSRSTIVCVMLGFVAFFLFREVFTGPLAFRSSSSPEIHQQLLDLQAQNRALLETIANLQRSGSTTKQRDPSKRLPANTTMSVFVRGYAEAKHKREFEEWMLRSLEIFWPVDGEYTLTVVLDDEDPNAHEWGKQLSRIPHVSVHYEEPRDELYHGFGHSRQQRSMFWADNFTNADYIAFIDSDTVFLTVVTYESLFDEQGRPRALTMIGPPTSPFWANMPASNSQWLKKPEVLRAMAFFPVIIKREHLQKMRAMVSQLYNGWIFDDAFRYLVTPDGGFAQFNIMMNYCWYFHRDEYAWFFYLVKNDWQGPPPKGQMDMATYFRYLDEFADFTEPQINPGLHASYYNLAYPDRPCCGELIAEGYCHAVDYNDAEICSFADVDVRRLKFFEGLFLPDVLPSFVKDHPKCTHVSRQHYRNIARSGYRFSEHQRSLVKAIRNQSFSMRQSPSTWLKDNANAKSRPTGRP